MEMYQNWSGICCMRSSTFDILPFPLYLFRLLVVVVVVSVGNVYPSTSTCCLCHWLIRRCKYWLVYWPTLKWRVQSNAKIYRPILKCKPQLAFLSCLVHLLEKNDFFTLVVTIIGMSLFERVRKKWCKQINKQKCVNQHMISVRLLCSEWSQWANKKESYRISSEHKTHTNNKVEAATAALAALRQNTFSIVEFGWTQC